MSRSCWSSAGSRSITSASSDGCSASRRCSRRRHVRADTVSAIAGGSTRLTSRCLVAGVFSLVEPEPTRGLETRTYRLQDSLSTLTMAATSDFSVYSDRSGGHSGYGGSEFASQVVSRRRSDGCGLQTDLPSRAWPVGQPSQTTTRMSTRGDRPGSDTRSRPALPGRT